MFDCRVSARCVVLYCVALCFIAALVCDVLCLIVKLARCLTPKKYFDLSSVILSQQS